MSESAPVQRAEYVKRLEILWKIAVKTQDVRSAIEVLKLIRKAK
jgi:hypothetical protein